MKRNQDPLSDRVSLREGEAEEDFPSNRDPRDLPSNRDPRDLPSNRDR